MRKEQEENRPAEEAGRGTERIYLQIENPGGDETEIDLFHIASQMSRKKRLYGYLFAMAVSAGVFAGLFLIGIRQVKGDGSYAQAVITFQYEGIEEGIDPNGAAFDINKLKSPTVIESALEESGISDASVEDIRQNIMIEGVIPKDAVERITVINAMAEKDASNYEKIMDVTYFPSQYVVSMYQGSGMSASETREILNAVLESYRRYFLDTYANTAVLTVTGNLLSYEEYDYGESVDMLQTQLDIMLHYVQERGEQAPDFRSADTGLSFGDITASLETVKSIDMANLSSYIENNVLTKDRERQIEYYNFRIKNYTMLLSQQQTQLDTVQNTLDNYEKTAVVIVSGQENTQEISQADVYYDELVSQKLALSEEIAETNAKLNEAYILLDTVSSTTRQSSEKEYETADRMLEKLVDTLTQWSVRIEQTTEEYYSTTLFSNAVKIAVPAQFKAAGGIVSIARTVFICVAVAVLAVAVLWSLDGLRMELLSMRGGRQER